MCLRENYSKSVLNRQARPWVSKMRQIQGKIIQYLLRLKFQLEGDFVEQIARLSATHWVESPMRELEKP